MSIERAGKMYRLYCDICQEEHEEDFDAFYKAVDYKIENDWGSKNENGNWLDICPNCLNI